MARFSGDWEREFRALWEQEKAVATRREGDVLGATFTSKTVRRPIVLDLFSTLLQNCNVISSLVARLILTENLQKM